MPGETPVPATSRAMTFAFHVTFDPLLWEGDDDEDVLVALETELVRALLQAASVLKVEEAIW